MLLLCKSLSIFVFSHNYTVLLSMDQCPYTLITVIRHNETTSLILSWPHFCEGVLSPKMFTADL